MEKVFKALSHPVRRAILSYLRERPMTAGELAERFDLTKPTLSGHFTVLRESDLITAERSGTTITYHLKLSVLEDALSGAMDLFRIGETKTEKRHEAGYGNN